MVLPVPARPERLVVHLWPLHLAAAIIAPTDTPDDESAATARQRYAGDLQRLEQLALRCLDLPDLTGDTTSFIYLLQALLAFRDEPFWQNELEPLADGEYELPCPYCEQDLYLVMDDRGYYASTFDTVTNSAATTEPKPVPLRPAAPRTLRGAGVRLHELAIQHRQQAVAQLLTFLFGHATCPACHTTFPIAQTIAGDDGNTPGDQTQTPR